MIKYSVEILLKLGNSNLLNLLFLLHQYLKLIGIKSIFIVGENCG